jgi:hypothetical protein
VPIYTPTYSYSDALFGVGQSDSPAIAEPEAPILARGQEAVIAEPEPLVAAAAPDAVHADAEIEGTRFEQPDFSIRLQDAIGLVDSDTDADRNAHEETTRSSSEYMSTVAFEETLDLDESEDIDLSGELAELQGEEEETSNEELFDGEPIGIYTMPSLTDEPEFEFSRLNFGRTRIEWPATPAAHVDDEPAAELVAESAAEASAPETAAVAGFVVEPEQDVEIEFETDTETEFETEAQTEFEGFEAEPELAAAADPELEVRTAAAFAGDVVDEERSGPAVALDADWDPADAEPAPHDAEPWAASTLSARWTWPLLEGLPSDAPMAGFARADSLAAAAEPLVPKKPADAGPRLVPPTMPSLVVPRAAAAPKLPSLTVPRAAMPAAAAPRPAAAAGAKSGRPEWSELVASLRKDIERRRTEPPQEKPKAKPSAAEIVAPAPEPVPVSASAQVPAPVMRRSRRSKPIQDEWGFFDPEQCGFAALLAKLDEITEGAEEKEVRQRT